MKRVSITFPVVVAAAVTMTGASAFLSLGSSTATTTRRSAAPFLMVSQDDSSTEFTKLSRRTWMAQVSVGTAAALFSSSPSPVRALVYVDPNRYGDKELVVGIMNKLRQCVRDVILKDVQLAPLFLELAIQDALTYNTLTQKGGPNGRIVQYLLETKQPASLYSAAQELQAIRGKLQQSTEITMADLVTFAGAEAMESLGGPRIVLQLGKLDDVDVNNKLPMTIHELDNGPETIQAFQQSGLTERDVTLLFGAMASMEQIVEKQLAMSNTDNHDDDYIDEDEEENEMGDPNVEFATSFGAPSQIYGKQLGRMDDSIYKQEVTLQRSKQATGIWANEIVGEWTMRYAKGGFFKDLPEAYSRLVQVGSTGRWEE